MARTLKVYRTPIGFHDAYVAASSQKEALRAWGSTADLFARGMAETVTDAALTREPLANPGTVVRRPRGTAAEHLAALPADAPVPRKRSPSPQENDDGPPPRRGRGSRPAGKPSRARSERDEAPRPEPKPAPPPKPKPKPSRATLDTAERAIEDACAAHEAALADIRRRQAELQDERRRVEERHERELRTLEATVDKVRRRYSAALETWRA